MEQEKYVENDVFKFTIHLDYLHSIFHETVYTQPNTYDEEGIKHAYFTQEKVDEWKRKIAESILSSNCPFFIECTDRDGGYNITEDQLFKKK